MKLPTLTPKLVCDVDPHRASCILDENDDRYGILLYGGRHDVLPIAEEIASRCNEHDRLVSTIRQLQFMCDNPDADALVESVLPS